MDEKSLAKLINTPLNDIEALHLCYGLPMSQRLPKDGKYRLYAYNELQHVHTPKRGQGFIVLYLETEMFGHYCAVKHDQRGRLIFFDPMGVFLDRELHWYDCHNNEKLNQNHTYLSNMFRNFPGEIEYNDQQYQKDFKDDQTCGRQCGIFLLLSDRLTLNQYRRLMTHASKKSGYTIPQLVTLLSDQILYPERNNSHNLLYR
jgi:hypothetical protein